MSFARSHFRFSILESDMPESEIPPLLPPESSLEATLTPPWPEPEPKPSGAPWNFLDLVFALMTILGSLFLAEFGGVVLLTVVGMMRGSAPSGGELISRLTSDVRLILP